ncbi:MAG: S8 family serine peptidase [Verrucomicrobia bacterium]|nr:S8 family serine peptidase [Verrucomicrobiota bacterium]
MKMPFKSCLLKSAVALLACAGLLAATAPSTRAGFDFDERGNAFMTGQAIVCFRAGTLDLTARTILASLGADPNKTSWFDSVQKNIWMMPDATPAVYDAAAKLARMGLVSFPDAQDALLFCTRAAGNSSIEFAHPNYLVKTAAVPNDSFLTLQWGLVSGKNAPNDPVNNSANLSFGKIGNFPNAWDIAKGNGIRIGIVDTGCDLIHPDLKNRLFLSGGALHIPVAPVVIPGTPIAPGAPWDDNGHGTVVTGIAGAQSNNRTGISGAAPGAIIVPIKAANNLGTATTAQMITGIGNARVLGSKVINVSLTQPGAVGLTAGLQAALNLVITSRAIVVAAMGDAVPPAAALFDYREPAGAPGVIAVGAHDFFGTRSPFSVNGPWICTAAPGGSAWTSGGAGGGSAFTFPALPPFPGSPWQTLTNIFSTYPTYFPNGLGVRGYIFAGGTSMAAPFVSGAAAMLFEKEPGFSSAQMWARFARFANRATLPAVVQTNVIWTSPTGSYVYNPALFTLFPPTSPGIKNPTAATLLINTPHNYRIGHGLLDAYRLLVGIECPALMPNGAPVNSVPTGYVRIFPYAPRHMFTTTNDITGALNGMDQPDRNLVSIALATNFKAIMVDDKGKLLPGGLLYLRFVRGLIPGSPITSLSPFVTGVTLVQLFDDGLALHNDTLANDGIYGSVSLGWSALYPVGSSVLFQYNGSAPGQQSNTNVFFGLRRF